MSKIEQIVNVNTATVESKADVILVNGEAFTYKNSGLTRRVFVNKAKIYGGTGGARGVITWFANNFPDYPTPELIKLTVTGMEVIDETARIKKAQERKLKAEEQRKARKAKYELEQTQRNLEEAQARLNKLKNK